LIAVPEEAAETIVTPSFRLQLQAMAREFRTTINALPVRNWRVR
jgi:hypothetical protein